MPRRDAALPLPSDDVPSGIRLPMFGAGLCAGFPSPAEDYMDDEVDLGRLLAPNPPATFLWRVDGNSMRDAGIFHGDLLVVDRSLEPRRGDVVVAVVDGTVSLKRYGGEGSDAPLSFANADMAPYRLPDAADVQVWGVVLCNVHWLRKAR